MGISLNALRKSVADDDKVLVTIVTDGYENASQEYSGQAIKALVDELKAKGWVFSYIGANHDVESVAASISITNTLRFNTTSEGVADMTSDVCYSRSCWYDSIEQGKADSEEANKNFFQKVLSKL